MSATNTWATTSPNANNGNRPRVVLVDLKDEPQEDSVFIFSRVEQTGLAPRRGWTSWLRMLRSRSQLEIVDDAAAVVRMLSIDNTTNPNGSPPDAVILANNMPVTPDLRPVADALLVYAHAGGIVVCTFPFMPWLDQWLAPERPEYYSSVDASFGASDSALRTALEDGN